MSDRIKVKNIYYMLAYAYQSLQESGFDKVSSESFDHIHDLMASILIQGVGSQIKRGLHKDYQTYSEATGSLRGRICLTESIKERSILRKQMVCAFDEFTEDTAHNQIIKTTMMMLIRYGRLKQENKHHLRKLIVYFANVTNLEKDSIRWDALKYHRNNAAYKMLINICWLVLEGMLMQSESGKVAMNNWICEEKMYRLYERFVLEYYKKEHPEYCARAAYIDWNLDDAEASLYLPIMKSDITLTLGNKTLIIDTKWYSHTMQTHALYDSRTFISGNLYQIYTYVKNKDNLGTGNVAGVLLYAKTDEVMTPDHEFVMGGSRIGLKTLDLNRDWNEITEQLEALSGWLV